MTIRSAYIDHERSKQARTARVSDSLWDGVNIDQQTSWADDSMNAAWSAEILKHSLSPKDWRLLELKYVLGYSDQDIARELQYAPGSIRTLLLRARQRARAILDDQKE